jgi:membrane protease YdiL (CAAX protease family)
MLSAKPWRSEAVVRLFLSVIVCMYAGSLVMSVLHYFRSEGKPISLGFLPLALSALICLGATLGLLHKPWILETFIRRLILLLGCFYAGLFLGYFAQKMTSPADHSTAQMLVGTLSFQGAALILISLFLREHQFRWAEAFGFLNRWHYALLLGIVAACLFLPVGRTLQWLSFILMENHLPVKPEEQEAVQTLRAAASWLDRLSLGTVTILLAPIGEETLFRGILYPWIKQAGFPRLALWITSVIFAVVHRNLMIFLPLLVLAILLTILYERTNNLLAPIAAHALFNAMNFVMLYLSEQR